MLNLTYYYKRICHLGINGLTQTIKHRCVKNFFAHRFKTKAQQRQAHHTWHDIANKYKISKNFAIFWHDVSNKPIIKNLINTWDLVPQINIFERADKAARLEVNLLGSGQVQLELNDTVWHKDFKPQITSTNNTWPADTFYQNIMINTYTSLDLNNLGPDIKVPWELSRLQHLIILGKGYVESKKAHDSQRTQHYAQAFQEQVTHWLDHNPYLLGVNWVCPMEVSIRAINLLWSIAYFYDETSIPMNFWQRLICSLYDHAIYLEHNWEWSDKPNNHYLADLVGYFYINCFFHDKQAQAKTLKELLAQWQQQIQPDGTSYEGSTAYHRLDIEMMKHVIALCKIHDITLPGWIHKQYATMQTFLVDCTDSHNDFITIGDDDSGKLVHGINLQQANAATHVLKTYRDFGLSIIKETNWHVTFRHATFNQRQPTGHFHQDQLSVTVSINGNPIFIDPGSYVYTAHAAWRNQLRSWNSHTTFYHDTNKPEDLIHHDLFQLPRREQSTTNLIQKNNDLIYVQDSYQDNQNILYERELIFNKKQASITLNDIVQNKHQEIIKWNFILHHSLEVAQQRKNLWIIMKAGKEIAFLESGLELAIMPWHYALSYGEIMPTWALTGTVKVMLHQKIITTLQCL